MLRTNQQQQLVSHEYGMSAIHKFIRLLLFVLINCSNLLAKNNTTWDVLVFTQHWPITVCMEWEASNAVNNCTLPPKEKLWTIHGIWPTRSGSSRGPSFCNRSLTFEPEQLQPILPDLELYWMNIEANTPLYALWKHEWDKHGTCAAALFDSQLSYFRQGLQWIQEYDMNVILDKYGIEPQNGGYAVDELFHTLRSALNKSAYIACVKDKRLNVELLSEIRMCFDTSLNLIDCDVGGGSSNEAGYDDGEKVLTNCNQKQYVRYFAKVPPLNTLKRRRTHYIDRLSNALQFVQTLIWITL